MIDLLIDCTFSPDEMRLSGVESGHEVVQLLLVERGDRLSAALLLLPARALVVLPGLARMVAEDLVDQPDVRKHR